jgi:hypothetical protein
MGYCVRLIWGEGFERCVGGEAGRSHKLRCGENVDFADELIADRMAEEQADVAQLVEQLIRNQQVNGSSPFVGSIESEDRVSFGDADSR